MLTVNVFDVMDTKNRSHSPLPFSGQTTHRVEHYLLSPPAPENRSPNPCDAIPFLSLERKSPVSCVRFVCCVGFFGRVRPGCPARVSWLSGLLCLQFAHCVWLDCQIFRVEVYLIAPFVGLRVSRDPRATVNNSLGRDKDTLEKCDVGFHSSKHRVDETSQTNPISHLQRTRVQRRQQRENVVPTLTGRRHCQYTQFSER